MSEPIERGVVPLHGTSIVAWTDGHRHALALAIQDGGRATAIRWGSWREDESEMETENETIAKEAKRRVAAKKELARPLTPQETATMWRILRGDSNKQIARALGIAEHTAKFHVRNAITKLGCTRRDAAVLRFVFLSPENVKRARAIAAEAA